jgi:hypothetical protein
MIAVCYGLARFAYGLFVPAFSTEFNLDAAAAGGDCIQQLRRVLVSWPISGFADALLASPDETAGSVADVDAAVAEFCRLVEHVLADETVHPPARRAAPAPGQR